VSSIHEALRKAERERKARLCVTASCVVSAGSRRRRIRWIRGAAAGIAAAGCVALVTCFLSKPEISGGRGAEYPAPPVRAPAKGAGHTAAISVERFETENPAEELKLFRMARVMHQAGKLEEAGALYEEACRINPRFVEAKSNLGVVYLTLEDYTAAENAFLDVTAINPEYPDGHYNLACVYAVTGRKEKALSALSRAIGLEPEVRRWALVDKDLSALRDEAAFSDVISPVN
jgi:tetratricopeptide (TPR) repeat protein